MPPQANPKTQHFLHVVVTALVVLSQLLPPTAAAPAATAAAPAATAAAPAATAAAVPPPARPPIARVTKPQYDWSRGSFETWGNYFERVARQDEARFRVALVATLQEILNGSGAAYQTDEDLYTRIEYYVSGKFIEPVTDKDSSLRLAHPSSESARRRASPSSAQAADPGAQTTHPWPNTAPSPELAPAYNNWLPLDGIPASAPAISRAPKEPLASAPGAPKVLYKLNRYTAPPEAAPPGRHNPALLDTPHSTLPPAGHARPALAASVMAGVITVTADIITSTPGLTQASGQLVLGDYFPLSGDAAWDGTVLTGTGNLAMIANMTGTDQIALFTSTFTASTDSGVIIPSHSAISAFQLDQLAGFNAFSVTISAINLVHAIVTGTASITLTTPGVQAAGGVQATTTVLFVLQATPGGVQYTGSVDNITLEVGGMTLQAGDVSLSNAGIGASAVTLTVPALFGSGFAVVNDLLISPTGLSLGSAGLAFDLPDLAYGDGSKLKLTGNRAMLEYGQGEYAFAITSTLAISLPANVQNISTTVNLAYVGGQSQLTGTLAGLSLTVAGATLAMNDLAFSNSGVSVVSATLTLPPSLGSASAMISATNVTSAGLSFAEAQINFPDIKFGDGDKVKVTGAKAQLKTKDEKYGFDAQGTLAINLPGNQHHVSLAFSMQPDGSLDATIVELELTIAGCKLVIGNLSLSNDGLVGQNIALTLPASLGGTTGALSGLRITADGLSFDQASITLPDIKFGDGSQVMIQDLTATLSITDSKYTLGVSGTLALRLPDNHQDIQIAASLDSGGNLSASINGPITLNIATAAMTLSDVTLDNAGLSVGSASLKLPGLLGGVEGSLTDVRITQDGLVIGGGAASVTFPDFTIGGASTHLKVSGVRLQIEFINNDLTSSYKLTLSGTVGISVSEQSASASGLVSLDNYGQLSGSVSSFSLNLAGMALEATDIQFSGDGSLSIQSAMLKLPAAFGGGGASLENVTISKSGDLSIGGGSFTLPTINAGGFKLQLSGELVKVDNDYQVSASGTIAIPGFGAAAGCNGIEVGVVIYATSTGQAAFQIFPVEAIYAAHTVPATYGPDATTGYSLKLKEATLGMTNCKIPVASTGVYITALSGQVTLGEDSTEVKVNLSLSAGPTLFGISALSGDLATTLTTNPFSLAMAGTINLLSIQVGGADAHLTSDHFSANLWIDMKYLRGNLAVNAWSDYRGFHLTGSAQMTLSFDQGAIANYCVPVLQCSTTWVTGESCTGSGWWRICVPWAYPSTSCWWENACISIPPWPVNYSVGVDVGEFSNGAWGFKGYVSILDVNYGFYIDSRKDIMFGNVDSYRLVTPATVLRARQAAKLRAAGVELPARLQALDYINFNALGEIEVNVPVTQTSEAAFNLTRLGDAPTLRLIAPDGTTISPAQLPDGVKYHEFVTYTVQPAASISSTFTLLEQAQAQSLDGGGLGLSLCRQQTAGGRAPSLAGSVPAAERVARYLSDDLNGIALQVPAVPTDASADAAPVANLRFLHAWPDAGALDVWVDGDPYAKGLKPYSPSRYSALEAGQHTIQVRPAGVADTLLLSATVSLAAYTDYTFALTGQDTDRGHWLMVDENRPLPNGQALVRFVNLSPGSPAVDLTDPHGGYYTGRLSFKTASHYIELKGQQHDLQVRRADQASVLVKTNALTFTQDSIYSVFLVGGMGITSGLQLVSSLDAARPAQVRFVNAVAGGPDLDVLHAWPGVTPEASLAWIQIPYGQPTAYAADPADSVQLIVTPAGIHTQQLISLTLDLESGQDYTLIAAGRPDRVEPIWLKDDNRLPALGQARLRLVALSPGTPAVDVAVRNGPVLAENIAYRAASPYASLAGGRYDLEIRLAGSSTVLINLPAQPLKEGQVYSLFLVGTSGGQIAVLKTDLATDKRSQVMYQIQQAQQGNWRAILSGDFNPGSTYVFQALGTTPAPRLSDASVTLRNATTAEVKWHLTSPQANTKISIFANPGMITTTAIVTTGQNVTKTVEIPYFAGRRLAYGLSGSDESWVNGSLQTHTLHLLSSLPSGDYHVWIEALDEHNPPTRVYIPGFLRVALPWASSWQAGLTTVASYRTLEVSWQDNVSADVDHYILYARDQSAQTMQYAVGDAHNFTLTGLDPAQAYTLWIDAVDTRTGRTSHSEQITTQPRNAPFSLSLDPPSIKLSNGQTRTITATIRTNQADYPGVVRLYHVDEGKSVDMHITFAQDTVAPTQAGVVVTGSLFAPRAAAGGAWSEVILAVGGGNRRYAHLPVTITNPYFDLIVTPDHFTLNEGESIRVWVDVVHFQNHTDPVKLAVYGSKDLSYALSQEVVRPGQYAMLLITDTQRTPNTAGDDLFLSAVSPMASAGQYIHYQVIKPDFRIERPPARPMERVNLLAGESITLPFEIRSLNNWTRPVSVTYLQYSVMTATMVRLYAGDGALLDRHAPIASPQSIYLQVDSTPDTPLSTYGYRTEVCGLNVRSDCAQYTVGVYAPDTAMTDLYAHLHQRLQLGNAITYTWHVGNVGPLTATHVVMTIPLPYSMTLSSVQPGECALDGEQVVCKLGAVPRQGQSVIEMTLQAASGLDVNQVFLHGPCPVTADQQDLDPGDIEPCIDPPPVQNWDLGVSMSAGPEPVQAGQNLTYTITVSNAGPGPAESIGLDGVLPWGLTLVTSDTSQGECGVYDTTLSCGLGRLAAGQTTTLRLVTQVPEGMQGTLINNIHVAHYGMAQEAADANPHNNHAIAHTHIRAEELPQPPVYPIYLPFILRGS